MKRWWIIYDELSQSVEYHNIINFIKRTFYTKRVHFNVIPNFKLTKEYLLKSQKDNMLPDIVLFWCSENLQRKQLLSQLGIIVINGYNDSFICENKDLQLKMLSQEQDTFC